MMDCRVGRLLTVSLFVPVLLLLAACQPLSPVPATVEPTAVPETSVTPTPAPAVVAAASPVTETVTPVSLAIPEIDLSVPVSPMGWEPVDVGGMRTTRWIVPEDAAGWALNSAGAGGAGNTVIAGHQALGDAVFAAIALGDAEIGQSIVLADEDGNEYTYSIIEISDPIPLVGATDVEIATAAEYMAPTDEPRLTLVTGWPAATTTHRLFVVAGLSGVAQ